MRIGIILSPAAGFSYDEIRESALAAERSGFASFWVSDHFFGGQTASPDRDCLEAWTVMAALARDTSTIRLGTLVTAAQYRNPALLAKIAAGVDHMSGGRVEFGVGAGWKEAEYRAYGYDFLPPGERVAQLKDALEIVTRLWSEERATYHGRHYRIEDAVCSPKPLQRPRPPIWVGGDKERVMRLAARYADGFDIGRHGAEGADLTPAEMTAAIGELRAIEGRAKRRTPLRTSHWGTVKPEQPEPLLERLRGFERAGLDQFLCGMIPRERSPEAVQDLASVLRPLMKSSPSPAASA